MNGFVRVGMGGDIVEETVGGSEVKLGGVGLVGGELTDGSEDGEVKGSCVEEQGSNRNSSGCIVSAPTERSYDLPIEGRSPTTGLSQNTKGLTQIGNRIMINLYKYL